MKNLSEWLAIEGLHDKNITGINVIDDKTVVMYISDTENDSVVKVAFVNTYHMRIDNFLLGNIILSIEVYESDEVDKLERDLLYLMDLNSKNAYHQETYNKIKNRFLNKKMLFVRIDPSYGLSGYFLCEEIKLVE